MIEMHKCVLLDSITGCSKKNFMLCLTGVDWTLDILFHQLLFNV